MSYLRRLLGHDERVLFTVHQHWTAFIGNTWHLVVLFVLGATVAVAINLLSGTNATIRDSVERWTTGQQTLFHLGIFVVLLIYPAIRLAVRYVRWRAEQYVVTNLRVIQLGGVLSKRVLDSSLEKVNDVMLEQSLLGRLFGYGDVEILTASAIAVNKFVRVARPLAFKAAMLNAKQDLEAMGRTAVGDPAKIIAELGQLRDRGVLTEEEFQAKKQRLLSEI